MDEFEEENNELKNIDNELEQPSSLSFNEDTALEEKEEIKAKGNFKKIKVLLSNPFFLVILLAIAVIVIGLIAFFFNFDGSTKYKKSKVIDYLAKCNAIYLAKEKEEYINNHQDDPNYHRITNPLEVDINNTERFEYKKFSINEFVAGVVWQENYLAHDVDSDLVYQALSIAVRTNVVRELNNNCVILRDYNPYNFKDLNGTENKYKEIIDAVNFTQGLIIGRDDKLIDAKYDNFSYVKRKADEDPNIKKYIYYTRYANEREQQLISSEWVEENVPEELIKKVPNRSKLEYLSIYGAKYLTQKAGLKYNVYRIVEYYYGKDIDYYSIAVGDDIIALGGNSTGCMWWPVGSMDTTSVNDVLYAMGSPSSTDITSGYGYRDQPTAGASTNHLAIDIGGHGNTNTNIIAVASGVITDTHTSCVEGGAKCSGAGNYITIKHNDGTITKYSHLSKVLVSVGQNVNQGQVIGKMGSTGIATGVHLDFKVIVNGNNVNPLDYLDPSNPRKSCTVDISGFTYDSGTDNKQTICLSLKASGFSDNIIAGIMGNIQQESQFNPLAVNSIGCSGIVQWCYGRTSNLKSTYGDEWGDLRNQLEFMLYELENTEKKANTYLKSNPFASIDEITDNFCMLYERPGVSSCEANNRRNYANNLIDYVKNGCQ